MDTKLYGFQNCTNLSDFNIIFPVKGSHQKVEIYLSQLFVNPLCIGLQCVFTVIGQIIISFRYVLGDNKCR